MGTTSPTKSPFHLPSILQNDISLADLELPFLKEEIDNVIKEIPADKAPGPDGFNGAFVKNYWDIISEDFYELIKDFYHGKVNLQCINGSFITLILKKDNHKFQMTIDPSPC